MHQTLVREVAKLKNNPRVDPEIYDVVWKWISTTKKILKAEGTTAHLCTMFAPYDHTKKKIFLIHHRKANLWMIPGGHVEPHETATECVLREFKEELGKSIESQQVELFNVLYTKIENPRQTCTMHYDLWYIVHTPVELYTIETTAFYAAGWFDLDTALQKVTLPTFNALLRKLKTLA